MIGRTSGGEGKGRADGAGWRVCGSMVCVVCVRACVCARVRMCAHVSCASAMREQYADVRTGMVAWGGVRVSAGRMNRWRQTSHDGTNERTNEQTNEPTTERMSSPSSRGSFQAALAGPPSSPPGSSRVAGRSKRATPATTTTATSAQAPGAFAAPSNHPLATPSSIAKVNEGPLASHALGSSSSGGGGGGTNTSSNGINSNWHQQHSLQSAPPPRTPQTTRGQSSPRKFARRPLFGRPVCEAEPRGREGERDGETEREREREGERETDRQTGRQTDKRRNRQTDRQTDRRTEKQTDRQRDRQTAVVSVCSPRVLLLLPVVP